MYSHLLTTLCNFSIPTKKWSTRELFLPIWFLGTLYERKLLFFQVETFFPFSLADDKFWLNLHESELKNVHVLSRAYLVENRRVYLSPKLLRTKNARNFNKLPCLVHIGQFRSHSFFKRRYSACAL